MFYGFLVLTIGAGSPYILINSSNGLKNFGFLSFVGGSPKNFSLSSSTTINTRENYVYGCYFVSNVDTSKVDSAFNSLHFERITIPSEFIGTPKDACVSMQKDIEEGPPITNRQKPCPTSPNIAPKINV